VALHCGRRSSLGFRVSAGPDKSGLPLHLIVFAAIVQRQAIPLGFKLP
jgi:hypothetical protein